jgi:hypothetical protein
MLGRYNRPAAAEPPALTVLNADLLNLILSQADGLAVVRAGATCKQLRALATTDRLWREICVKRWPSTARLRAQPSDHRTFYFQRIRSFRNPPSQPPEIDVNTVALMIDGRVCGPFSEVLYFADAKIERVVRGEVQTDAYVWDVPVLRELVAAFDIDSPYHWHSVDIEARFLRDDGKFAQQVSGLEYDCLDSAGCKSLLFSRTLDLLPHAEWFSRQLDLYHDMRIELGEDGKARAWCTSQAQNDGAAAQSFGFVLAFMEWK